MPISTVCWPGLKKLERKVDSVFASLKITADSGDGGIEKAPYIIPPHLFDLQEAELPKAQHGLIIATISPFRERAAKRERERLKDERERGMAFDNTTACTGRGGGSEGFR